MNVSKDWADEHAAVGLRKILLSSEPSIAIVGDFAVVQRDYSSSHLESPANEKVVIHLL